MFRFGNIPERMNSFGITQRRRGHGELRLRVSAASVREGRLQQGVEGAASDSMGVASADEC